MANVAELPLSIIQCEILPRVPAKSVGRCMCVCKQWKSFLSTPMFSRMHLRYNVTAIDQYKLLMRLDNDTFSTLDGHLTHRHPNPDPNSGGFFVLASLDGLVCLGSLTTLAFWNPLTGAYKRLPPIPCGFPVFSNSIYDGVGFYIDSSNDYKLLYMMMGCAYGVYIYSNRLDSWRQIDFPEGVVSDDDLYQYRYQYQYQYCLICSEATAFGQCLYFIMTDVMNSAGTSWIICFDVKSEKVRKIGFPNAVPAGIHNQTGLVLLYGCIHLCVSYYINDHKWADLWRMDGDAWVKVFSDPLPYTILPKSICTATMGNWLAVLEEESNSFKKMNTEDFTTCYRYFCSLSFEYRSTGIIYVETLVSP